MDFEYQTVSAYGQEVFGTHVDLGKGLANRLVNELVKNGTYSVIDRQALDKVLQEQNFQNSNRSDPSTAAQIGKMLGVDAIVAGAVTKFGRDDQNKGVSTSGVGIGPIGIGGVRHSSSKAVVGLDLRLIDVQTGEILAVASGEGTSSRSGTSLSGLSVGNTSGDVDMSSSNFDGTIVGEATKKAIDDVVKEIVAAAPRIVQKKVAISALVADVSGTEITLNVGTAGGVRNGETYDVVRPAGEVKDPATGRVIRVRTTPVGTVKITDVQGDFSTGTLTGGPAKVGDCVGSCPAKQNPPPQDPAPAQAPAATAAPTPAAPSGPVTYPSGGFAWTPYQFKGTEHFKYNVASKDGNGFYQLDLQPAGAGKVRMIAKGQVGGDSYSSTMTVDPQMGMMANYQQLATMGPLAIMMNPGWAMMFGGREMTVGDGWSSSQGGHSASFKVESTCAAAGQGGVMLVGRENNQITLSICMSPNVALPLSFIGGDKGELKMTLVEYHS